MLKSDAWNGASSRLHRRSGQGRALGLLYLWLEKASLYNRDTHAGTDLKRRLGSEEFWEERKEARKALALVPGSAALFKMEREMFPDEDNEEPRVVPA